MSKDSNPLTYRRFYKLLFELENRRLVTSRTSSKGRQSYGTQFNLVPRPEAIGKVCFPDWWDGVVRRKVQHDKDAGGIFNPRNYSTLFDNKNGAEGLLSSMNDDDGWKEFLGLE